MEKGFVSPKTRTVLKKRDRNIANPAATSKQFIEIGTKRSSKRKKPETAATRSSKSTDENYLIDIKEPEIKCKRKKSKEVSKRDKSGLVTQINVKDNTPSRNSDKRTKNKNVHPTPEEFTKSGAAHSSKALFIPNANKPDDTCKNDLNLGSKFRPNLQEIENVTLVNNTDAMIATEHNKSTSEKFKIEKKSGSNSKKTRFSKRLSKNELSDINDKVSCDDTEQGGTNRNGNSSPRETYIKISKDKQKETEIIKKQNAFETAIDFEDNYSFVELPEELKEFSHFPKTCSIGIQILKFTSNMYMNVAERLFLKKPTCLEDLEHCYQNHCQSKSPTFLSKSDIMLFDSLMSARNYDSVFSTIICFTQRLWVGSHVLTNIVESLLSLNNFEINETEAELCLLSTLFSSIVSSHPPCCSALHASYLKFFQTPLTTSKLFSDKKKFHRYIGSQNLLEVLLILLEQTVEEANEVSEEANEVSRGRKEYKLHRETVGNSFLKPNLLQTPKKTNRNENAGDISFVKDFKDWESDKRNKQYFDRMTISEKTERLILVLSMMVDILEQDFVMWFMRHHNEPKKWILSDADSPISIKVLNIKQFQRCSKLTKKLFEIFARGVKVGMKSFDLQVIERYIGLCAIISNTIDTKQREKDIVYPSFGTDTKKLVQIFYETFKDENKQNIRSYLKAIDLLRVACLRCSFIEYLTADFLGGYVDCQMENLADIARLMSEKTFSKIKPAEELRNSDRTMSRECYLHVLLLWTISYCEWYGSATFLNYVLSDVPYSRMKMLVHMEPNSNEEEFPFPFVIKESTGETTLKNVFSKNLSYKKYLPMPIINILIDNEIISKYEVDLKCLVKLQLIIKELRLTYSGKSPLQDAMNKFEQLFASK